MCCYWAIFIWPREYKGFHDSSVVKNLPARRGVQKILVWSLGWEDPLEEEMATQSNTLDWKTSWTEEPGGLQSKGSQRVGHDWVTEYTHEKTSSEAVILCPSTWNGILRMAGLDVCLMTKWINAGLSASKPCLTFQSKDITSWPFSLSFPTLVPCALPPCELLLKTFDND